MIPGGFWNRLSEDALRSFATAALHVVIILAVYVVARRVLFRLIDMALERVVQRQSLLGGSEERSNRLRTLKGLARSIAGYVLVFVLVVMLLDALGANVAGVLTTAGVGGVAVGFGAQRLVRDVISGFFLIVEDQFAVGEYATVGGPAGSIAGAGVVGIIEDIGMRVTRIRDAEGRLWTIANGDIAAVVNHSRAPVQSVIEVAVAAGASIADARAAIDDAGAALGARTDLRLVAPPKSLGVSAFDAARTVISIGVSAEPRAMAETQRLVREAVRERLMAEGIALA